MTDGYHWHPQPDAKKMNPAESSQAQRWLAALFFAIFLWGIADILLDSPEELKPWHLTSEVILLIISLSGGIWLWRSWRQSEANLRATRESLVESNRDREEWHRRAAMFLDGFHQAVQEQFADWQLTPAEREVATYMLRGFSHKDTARFTQRSERTVRQHSVAVYRKARLAGRAELSAFFLEGLFAPVAEESTEAAPRSH